MFFFKSFSHHLTYSKILSIYILKNKIKFLLYYEIEQGEKASLIRNIFDENKDGKLSYLEQKKLKNFLVKTAKANIRFFINKKKIILKGKIYTTNISLPVNSNDSLSVKIEYIKKVNFKNKNYLIIKKEVKDELPVYLYVNKNFSILLKKKRKNVKLKKENKMLLNNFYTKLYIKRRKK
jgi:hypothetical protein